MKKFKAWAVINSTKQVRIQSGYNSFVATPATRDNKPHLAFNDKLILLEIREVKSKKRGKR